MHIPGFMAEIMQLLANSVSSRFSRQEGVCGALLDLGQRFSSGASHFDTQGEAIKLISGTESLLQSETNSSGVKQLILLRSCARARMRPRETSAPRPLPGSPSFCIYHLSIYHHLSVCLLLTSCHAQLSEWVPL